MQKISDDDFALENLQQKSDHICQETTNRFAR